MINKPQQAYELSYRYNRLKIQTGLAQLPMHRGARERDLWTRAHFPTTCIVHVMWSPHGYAHMCTRPCHVIILAENTGLLSTVPVLLFSLSSLPFNLYSSVAYIIKAIKGE